MPSPDRIVVAIDGPAGAGKSTVARLVSSRLGAPLLDTGAMYRCVGLLALRKGVSLEDEAALGLLAEGCEIVFGPGSPASVCLDGEEVTEAIRTLEASQAASRASVHSRVRRALVARQQAMIAAGSAVLEGRDTTTVVAPHATLKVFLTASAEERARRRWLEMKAAGAQASLQELVKETVSRDHRDYTRSDSPLTLAEDARLIETFGLTPEAVADRILEMLGS